jgi:arginine/lysine/ornithine decarboxylase
MAFSQKNSKIERLFSCIAGETIYIYPPGIPLVAEGEEITLMLCIFLTVRTTIKWQGWQGCKRGEFYC